MSRSIAASRWVLASIGAVFAAVLVPSAAAAVSSVGLQTNPAIQEYSPAATTTYQAWEQDSISHPSQWNVFAESRAGGSAWKVNATGTNAYVPSPVAGTAESIIYQQVGRSSNLFFYNLATHTRTAAPAKVDSSAWEYYGVASTKYIAFMRLTSTARVLLLYHRGSGRLTQIASSKKSCSSCLAPTWVGQTHLAYDSCSSSTNACNAKVLTIRGATVTVPRAPAPHSNYGAAMDESTGDIYFVSTTSYCGLFVSLDRWNLHGGVSIADVSALYDLPEGFDIQGAVSLAADQTTSTDTDALYSQFDCLAQNYDNYELQSVNTLPPLATATATAAPPPASRADSNPNLAAVG